MNKLWSKLISKEKKIKKMQKVTIGKLSFIFSKICFAIVCIDVKSLQQIVKRIKADPQQKYNRWKFALFFVGSAWKSRWWIILPRVSNLKYYKWTDTGLIFQSINYLNRFPAVFGQNPDIYVTTTALAQIPRPNGIPETQNYGNN